MKNTTPYQKTSCSEIEYCETLPTKKNLNSCLNFIFNFDILEKKCKEIGLNELKIFELNKKISNNYKEMLYTRPTYDNDEINEAGLFSCNNRKEDLNNSDNNIKNQNECNVI